MTELVFIATDFQTPLDERYGKGDRRPMLEHLLSRARHRRLDGDWRDWLGASMAPLQLTQFSIAAIAGAAFRDRGAPVPESIGYWLATPMHLFAGLDSLHVHPCGLLQLSADEQQALATDFAHVFSDSPWRLQCLGRRELLLCGPVIAADGADPATLLGCDPTPGLPRGEGAGALRRLGSEIEMWLHGHAVNRAREARAQLPVTAMWLWGGRALRPMAGLPLRRPQIFGHDIYVEALSRLLRVTSGDLSTGLSAIETVPNRITSDTVVLMEHLPQIEHHLAAAVRAVRRRQLSLHLAAGNHLFSLSPWRLLQWWMRPRPWWEVLA